MCVYINFHAENIKCSISFKQAIYIPQNPGFQMDCLD